MTDDALARSARYAVAGKEADEHTEVAATLAATRVVLRPLANPFALGMLGLAGSTVVLSGLELGWIPAAQKTQASVIILIFAPLLQLIACVFGFLGRDPVASTGMGVLSGAWAIIGLVHLLSPASSRSIALGTFLFLAAVAIGLSAATGMQTKVVPGLVMLTTAIRWMTTAIYEVVGGHDLRWASGIIGLILGALAIYGAFAIELENLHHAPVLPMLRRGKGKTALSTQLADQVEDVAAEPGVRNQL